MNRNPAFVVLLTAIMVLGAVGCDRINPGDTARDISEATTFCEEHQIAEAQCPFCDPSLLESMGYCPAHDVPEALCYQCNPALVAAFKTVGDWCAGHERPESQCYICNPELNPSQKRIPAATLGEFEFLRRSAGTGQTRSTDQLPRSQRVPVVSCAKTSAPVQFETPEIARQAGLQFATVESQPITETVGCNALLTYDGNRYAQLSAQVSGTVVAVHKDLGDTVSAGDALVTITSHHLGAAKAAYLHALAAAGMWERIHMREADLLERRVATERDLLEAETRLAESRISLSEAEEALLSFGLSEAQIETIQETGDTSAHYVIAASFPGVVVDRRAALGETVSPGEPLFAVSDLSLIWALLDVYETDLQHIGVGQPVVLHIESLPGWAFGGHITRVSSELNPRTRTLQARAEFDNSMGLLRANMFARASVSVRDRQMALVVPEAAVQWEGCCNVVFVKKSETVFEPRQVHLGVSTGTVYEVLSGLRQGEQVVTEGSFLLKTEILKGSIGAGCCEVQPGT